MPILECVPNVSEGRSAAILARLESELDRRDAVALLDRSSDVDHHRSVFTVAGEIEPLVAALLELAASALAEIDLRRHRGVHPRAGAVDVVPFVPLGSATMADAVAAARDFGRRAAERFGVPVYLYEEAATAPHRRRLAELRRGEFEGFPAKIREPGWQPDFGPARVHPSGGVIVTGARFFLVAFNLFLEGADITVARAIARAVRESSGGLPAVRALGFALPRRRLAAVSLNLVDYRRTSPGSAFRAVEEAARSHGVSILASEIVGLVPEQAVLGTTAEELRLRTPLEPKLLGAALRRAGFEGL